MEHDTTTRGNTGPQQQQVLAGSCSQGLLKLLIISGSLLIGVASRLRVKVSHGEPSNGSRLACGKEPCKSKDLSPSLISDL